MVWLDSLYEFRPVCYRNVLPTCNSATLGDMFHSNTHRATLGNCKSSQKCLWTTPPRPNLLPLLFQAVYLHVVYHFQVSRR